jgi:hypothetical protein
MLVLRGNDPSRYKLPKRKRREMKKEEVVELAKIEGSENGPLGKWLAARLDQFPEAGALTHVNGKWYVAVAGTRREGYKGGLGGLYARWVQVPETECNDWGQK